MRGVGQRLPLSGARVKSSIARSSLELQSISLAADWAARASEPANRTCSSIARCTLACVRFKASSPPSSTASAAACSSSATAADAATVRRRGCRRAGGTRSLAGAGALPSPEPSQRRARDGMPGAFEPSPQLRQRLAAHPRPRARRGARRCRGEDGPCQYNSTCSKTRERRENARIRGNQCAGVTF